MAIIVGSALHYNPTMYTTMSDLGFLSSDGRCRTFDSNGSGYVRGEGICAIVLKRRSLAESDGNIIRALVCGTGSNHDGQKESMTMPNSRAQEALMRRVYKDAGVSPNETSYFEAHGTGTQAGDPKEARAIGAVFAPKRIGALPVGSVKTNIGHLEGASGLASIIKTTMALEKGVIPPNMHFNRPNKNIDFEQWKIYVPIKATEWQPVGGVRRASINSFGYGGANAHVILEGPKLLKVDERDNTVSPHLQAEKGLARPFLLPFTSHTKKAGIMFRHKLAEFFKARPELLTEDLARSLSHRGRSMHQVRSYVIGKDRSGTIENLQNSPAPWTTSKGPRKRIGFIFTGQGAQWFAMGRQLIEHCPLFRQTIEKFDTVLQSLPESPEWSCIDELLKSKAESKVNEVGYSMPLCTAIQIAIVDLLGEWGIEPSATVGHSAGEIAAAYAAGILTFDDTVACSYYRAYALTDADVGPTRGGSMLAVGMTESEAASELEAYPGQICIAAINSPTSLTVSGDVTPISQLKEKLENKGKFVRQLQVERAFHSHHMVPYVSKLGQYLSQIRPQPAHCRMFSSVTARLVDATKMNGDYFVTNLISQVRYSDALTGTILDESEEQCVDLLVEIGPHPALKGPSRQTMQVLNRDVPYLASLTRGMPDFEALLSCAGELFAHGYAVNMEAVNKDIYHDVDGIVASCSRGRKLDLPKYAWDHRRYWAETRLSKDFRQRRERHSILGSILPISTAKHLQWRTFLRPTELPWLSHHMIEGKVIFPAAGYLTMALEAAIRRDGCPKDVSQILLEDVVIKSALVIPTENIGAEVLFEMQPVPSSVRRTSNQWYRFVISSYDESGQSNENCFGLIAVKGGLPASIDVDSSLQDLRKRSNKSMPLQKYYDHLSKIGLQYGDHFRLICGNIESGPGFAMAPLAFRPEATMNAPSDRCTLHPTLLDATLHPLFAGVEALIGMPLGEPFVPAFIKSMRVSGSLLSLAASDQEQRFWVCTNTELPGPRIAKSDITVRTADWRKGLIETRGLEATALGSGTQGDALGRSLFFRTRWQPAFTFLDRNQSSLQQSRLSSVMDVFAHQFPNCRILHVTSDVQCARELLQELGGNRGQRRRFQRLTLHSPSSDTIGEWREIEDEWPGLVDTTEPKAEDFDAIVLSEATSMDMNIYLKPDGHIITENVPFNTVGFSLIHQSPSINTWRRTKKRLAPDPVTLVIPSLFSESIETLVSLLTANYQGPVSRLSFEELPKCQSIKGLVIALPGLDENILFDAKDDASLHFRALKRLFTGLHSRIVWVSRGALMDSPMPKQAAVLGLARVLVMRMIARQLLSLTLMLRQALLVFHSTFSMSLITRPSKKK